MISGAICCMSGVVFDVSLCLGLGVILWQSMLGGSN
jgi:hypothetical protein